MPILPEHKEILLSQSNSKTLLEWVDFFNNQYKKNQIYSFCYRNHCHIKTISQQERSKIQSQNGRKYHINEHYFKKWSRNMAYIFGLWCADGCIYNNRLFDITLHKKDKYLLKQIAKELKYEGILYDYVDRQVSRINFSCKTIYDDLIALGGTENKSLTLKFPKIPEEYLPDFIRGYFDGNGCIMRLKNNRVNCAFTCGNKRFLIDLLKILKQYADVGGGSFDDSNMSLRFGKKDTLKIGNFIYKDNPELFLLRKKEKFY